MLLRPPIATRRRVSGRVASAPLVIRLKATLSALLLVVAFALVGCASDQYSVIFVENQTQAVLDVFLVPVGETDGSEVIMDIEPGTEYPYSDIAEGCSDRLQLLAMDQGGVVIARSPMPLCRPSRWVIER